MSGSSNIFPVTDAQLQVAAPRRLRCAGKIDGNRSSIHADLDLFEDLIDTPMKTRAPLLRRKPGGVHSIIRGNAAPKKAVQPPRLHVMWTTSKC